MMVVEIYLEQKIFHFHFLKMMMMMMMMMDEWEWEKFFLFVYCNFILASCSFHHHHFIKNILEQTKFFKVCWNRMKIQIQIGQDRDIVIIIIQGSLFQIFFFLLRYFFSPFQLWPWIINNCLFKYLCL